MRLIDMKLPHQEPVRFVKEVLEEGRNHAVSLVEFDEIPTLPAIVEASAQNTIFILSLFEIYHIGMLTGMKKIELYQELKEGIYRVETTISASLDNFFIFNFVLSQNDKKFVDGEITILLEKRDEKL
jgi:hypothetical protein